MFSFIYLFPLIIKLIILFLELFDLMFFNFKYNYLFEFIYIELINKVLNKLKANFEQISIDLIFFIYFDVEECFIHEVAVIMIEVGYFISEIVWFIYVIICINSLIFNSKIKYF